MVSTRKHPRAFPPPEQTPATATGSSVKRSVSPFLPTSPTAALATRRTTQNKRWSHTPSNIALAWLAVSSVLTLWDAAYVLGRPHTMPGGKYHWPVWVPYALYGQVDYVYGFPGYESGNGWNGAQSMMNLVEVALYAVYLVILFRYATEIPAVKGRGAPKAALDSRTPWIKKLARARQLRGPLAGPAVLLLFATSVFTCGKTVLYCKLISNQANSSLCRDGVGFPPGQAQPPAGRHLTLRAAQVGVGCVPSDCSSPWIIVPAYVAYISAAEILQGLILAA